VLVRIGAEVQEVPRALSARSLVRLALVVGGGAVVLGAYGTYLIWDQGSRDERHPAGAVVVLGAAQYDGRPSPVFAARLDHAVALYLAGTAPYLVVTGGKQAGDRTTEAATARRFALDRGVPDDAILLEDRGRTTVESLRAVARILEQRGIHDAVFVSDPTHMLRVLMIARDEGLTAYGSPTPTSPIEADTLSRLDATAHELGGIVQYLLLRWTGVSLGVTLP
jgi:uncharacterized SAM-binding protein YcdF (DUF218 family)